MRVWVPPARILSLYISELTYGNMAVCILQTFHLLTNAACAFAHMRVCQSELHIAGCCEHVVGVLVFVCVLVCVWACLVPHMCESVPLLGKSAARFASWHRAPLASRSLRTVRPSWSGHLSSLWRRVAELTEERERERERERQEEETAKAAQEQRAGAGSCPPQQDETLSQEISAGSDSERKRCCVLTRTWDFLWMTLNIIIFVVALSAWNQTHILHFLNMMHFFINLRWSLHGMSTWWFPFYVHVISFYFRRISSSLLSDTGCVSICPNAWLRVSNWDLCVRKGLMTAFVIKGGKSQSM